MTRDRILVLGLGNPLMGDDGAGLACLDLLSGRDDLPVEVDLVDGGTMGLYLIDRVSGYKNVVVLDSVIIDEPPGTVVVIEGEDVGTALREKLSAHQMGLNDLLSALALMGKRPEKLKIIGVAASRSSIGLGLEMSGEVKAAIGGMALAALEALESMGPVRPDRGRYITIM